MTAQELKDHMDNEARHSAQDVEPDTITRLAVIPEGLPEPELWTSEEFGRVLREIEELAAAATLQRAEVKHGVEEEVQEVQEPVDLTDPLKHIRELIIDDVPKAAFATDEELEVLYDDWQAKQDPSQEE